MVNGTLETVTVTTCKAVREGNEIGLATPGGTLQNESPTSPTLLVQEMVRLTAAWPELHGCGLSLKQLRLPRRSGARTVCPISNTRRSLACQTEV